MMNAVHPLSSMNRPDAMPFEPFQDAQSAVDRLAEIYARNTAFLRAAFREVLNGTGNGRERARAYYPAIRIVVETYDGRAHGDRVRSGPGSDRTGLKPVLVSQ